jgi:predicted Zn-dependent protease
MPSRSETFQGLVTRQPDNELFRFSLAQALVAEGRASEAVEHYLFCVQKKADWMMPRILLGKLYLQLGRRDEARPLLEAALQLAIDQTHEDPERELRGILAELTGTSGSGGLGR